MMRGLGGDRVSLASLPSTPWEQETRQTDEREAGRSSFLLCLADTGDSHANLYLLYFDFLF